MKFSTVLFRTIFSVAAMAMSACSSSSTSTGNNAGSGAPSGMDLTYDPPMLRVEPPNALGYSKIARRVDGEHFEGVLDSEGREVLEVSTKYLVVDVTDAVALLTSGRRRVFVDLSKGPYTAEQVEQLPGYTHADVYSCGVAAAMIDDRWFYIDPEGKQLFDQTFHFAETFHNNRAFVKTDSDFRIIDITGKTIAVFPDEVITPQSPWMWQVGKTVDGKYAANLLDLDGKRIAEVPYDTIGYYDPDVKRTRVGRDGKYGFVNEMGKVVIEMKYDYAGVFDRGIALVSLDGRQFYINPDGEEVQP